MLAIGINALVTEKATALASRQNVSQTLCVMAFAIVTSTLGRNNMTGLGLFVDIIALYILLHVFFGLIYLFFKLRGDEIE